MFLWCHIRLTNPTDIQPEILSEEDKKNRC